jgi:hypothetical protein
LVGVSQKIGSRRLQASAVFDGLELAAFKVKMLDELAGAGMVGPEVDFFTGNDDGRVGLAYYGYWFAIAIGEDRFATFVDNIGLGLAGLYQGIATAHGVRTYGLYKEAGDYHHQVSKKFHAGSSGDGSFSGYSL